MRRVEFLISSWKECARVFASFCGPILSPCEPYEQFHVQNAASAKRKRPAFASQPQSWRWPQKQTSSPLSPNVIFLLVPTIHLRITHSHDPFTLDIAASALRYYRAAVCMALDGEHPSADTGYRSMCGSGCVDGISARSQINAALVRFTEAPRHCETEPAWCSLNILQNRLQGLQGTLRGFLRFRDLAQYKAAPTHSTILLVRQACICAINSCHNLDT